MIVLFDLEGTLVQSIETDQEAIRESRIETLRKLLELGIPSMVLRGVRSSTLMRNRAFQYVKEHFSEKMAERFHIEIDRFQKSYELRYADRSKIFPDTLPALHKLKRHGCKMGLVTNTSREAANRILFMHRLETFFEVIVTREDVKRLKPDPEGILLALNRLNTSDFVFVGDLIHDSRATTKAGGVSIIVNRNPSNRLRFHANYVVRSLIEVPGLIIHLKTTKL